MYSEYISKSNSESTRTSQTIKQKKANSDMAKPFSMAKGMEPSYTGNNFYHSNKAIQMLKFGQGFKNPEKKQISNAVKIAITRLKNAKVAINRLNVTRNITLNSKNCLLNSINDVLALLGNQNLCFCPVPEEEEKTSYGFVFTGEQEEEDTQGDTSIKIYISTKAHESEIGIAKTIVHEAFHMVGGGTSGDESPCSETSNTALSQIKDFEERELINADSFAQYVMQC